MARSAMMLAVAVAACLLAPAAADYTADVILINLMDEPLIFGGCATSQNGSLPVEPHTIIPQQVSRFFINTTTKWEDVAGFCWWSIASAGKCDPTPPPAPVKSCPYIGWQRTVVVGQEDIEWEIETPGHIGIGDVSITKRIGHQAKQYCVCSAKDEANCQTMCKDI